MRYLDELGAVMRGAVAMSGTDRDTAVGVDAGLSQLALMMRSAHIAGRKVVVVGNGGSAAIASHVVIDLNKAAGVRAVALNDPAALTCLANDLSYQEVFATQIAWHGRPGDVLVAISSSGKSINILQTVEAARAARMRVVTFSGFRGDNPLRLSGDLNFYVPSDRYGFVELAHQILLHAVTDALGAERAKPAEAAE